MKKGLLKLISCGLVASLVLVGLPGYTPAEAAPSTVYVGGVAVSPVWPSTAPTYWVSDGSGGITLTGATEDNYTVKYDESESKLTLRNANITAVCNPSGGLRFSGGNLIIELVGNNTIAPGVTFHPAIIDSTADPSPHTLTIQGSGSLTATANGNGRSGIQAGHLIISSATVAAQGFSTGSENRGIKARSVTINSGSVTAVSADAVAGNTGPSAGIEAAEFVTVNGGTLTATGGGNAMTRQSYGILSPTVTIGGGTVTATGGQVQSNIDPRYSYGISASTGIALNGGTVIAKTNATANIRGAMSQAPALTGMGISVASSNSDGSAPVAYVAGDIANYNYLKAEPTTKETTPAATVDYPNEQLTGLTASAAYTVDGADFSADGSGNLALANAWFGNTIVLRKKGNGSTTSDSDPQSIALAARPAAPSCTVTQPNAGSATGSIAGITAAMEYSTDAGTNWTTGDGNDLTGLAAGTTVLIRVKAVAGTAPAGENQTVVITAYVPPASSDSGSSSNSQPQAPSSTVGAGGSISTGDLAQLASMGSNLTVSGSNGASLVFDNQALRGLSTQAAGNVRAQIQDVSAQHQSEHPGRVVFSLTVTAGNETISNFGGSVMVTLPYSLPAGQDPDNVTVWHQAADGTLTEVPCTYDPATGKVTFTVTHFSLYVIGAVTPEPKAEPAPAVVETPLAPPVVFADVMPEDWYYQAIQAISAKGLMGGTKAGVFSPQARTTRGMIVTILWRMEGKPAASPASFRDVEADRYYAEAVAWAAQQGIVSGHSAMYFAPDEGITREQLAGVLARYAAYKNVQGPAGADLGLFSDGDQVSPWAEASVTWAVANGLLGSAGDNRLEPQKGATRAQVAAILQRLTDKLDN